MVKYNPKHNKNITIHISQIENNYTKKCLYDFITNSIKRCNGVLGHTSEYIKISLVLTFLHFVNDWYWNT